MRSEDADGEERSDVAILDLVTGRLDQLTDGSADGAGYWSPLWSPDGKSLAVLTNRSGRQVGLAFISARDRKIRTSFARNVNVEVNFGSSNPFPPIGRKWGTWIDSEHFIVALMPDGEIDHFHRAAYPRAVYSQRWQATADGEASVTTWSSRDNRPCGVGTQLALVDSRSLNHQIIFTGSIRAVSSSPDRHWIALTLATGRAKQELAQFDYKAYNTDLQVITAISIYDMKSHRDMGFLPGTEGAGFNTLRQSVRWSPSSTRAYVPIYTGLGSRVVEIIPSSGQTHTIEARSVLDGDFVTVLAANSTAESSLGTLVARTELSRDVIHREWYGFSIKGGVHSNDNERVIVADGHAIFVTDRRGILATKLALDDVTPAEELVDAPRARAVLLRSSQGTFLLTHDNRLEEAIPPTRHALAVSVTADDSGILWADHTVGDGVLFFSKIGQLGFQRLLDLNPQIRSIPRYPTRLLQYSLPGGGNELARVFSPGGVKTATVAHPVIITGYPGVEIGRDSEDSDSYEIGFITRYRDLLLSEGFVVVEASLPIPSGSMEPLYLVSDQIEALAEKLVESRIAISGRIGFLGRSYGGYTALAVTARSKIIGAVVADASFSDLVDYDNHVQYRYNTDSCAPSRQRFHALEVESPYAYILRMESSSDEEFSKYIRNSPIFNFTRQSPATLILAGQFDARSFDQADAAFFALSRKGVDVEIARYWGEGHNLASPGNLRDAWTRIRSWFSRHLGA